MEEMNAEELAALCDALDEAVDRGDEQAAQAILSEHMQRLPQQVRDAILGRLFFEEMAAEAAEYTAVEAARRDGIRAAHALEELRRELAQKASDAPRV